MTENSAASGARRYFDGLSLLLDQIWSEESGAIANAGAAVADTIVQGGLVHVFGTGHSHILAEEMFYRAGGLANINPILIDELMLHAGATSSTNLERQSGTAATIFSDLTVGANDTFIVGSNSGGNAVCVELAELFVSAGACVVAIVSRAHASAVPPETGQRQLQGIAHIVIDNHGVPGDASVQVAGTSSPVGPTSTVAGAAIVNAITTEAVECLALGGHEVEILRSANTPGGDEHNVSVLDGYSDSIGAL